MTFQDILGTIPGQQVADLQDNSTTFGKIIFFPRQNSQIPGQALSNFFMTNGEPMSWFHLRTSGTTMGFLSYLVAFLGAQKYVQ